MRVSLFCGSDAKSVSDVVARVRRAHDAGLAGAFVPQTFSIDAMTALAVAGELIPDIELGTAVVPIQGRHPIPMAQQALTVASAVGPGRFTLGIGATHKPVSERLYDIPYAEMFRRCREQLTALDGLLSEDRTASFEGEFVVARMQIDADAPTPGLMVAALGPKMLELAGRLSDGTITWMTGPKSLGERIAPVINDAAAAVGRPAPRVMVGLPVVVTDDPDGARERMQPYMAGAATMPSYAKMCAAEGVDDPVELAIVGGEDEVLARIAGLRERGGTELLANIWNGTDDDVARTLDVLGELNG